jgi:hypothetical protein
MSLPFPERPSTSLPSLPSVTQPSRAEPRKESWEEVLQITLAPSSTEPDALTVSFAAEGFDVSDDETIIDILKIALVSYGIKTVDPED